MLLKTPGAVAEFRRLLRVGPCADIPVSTSMPEDIAVPMVRIERIGGRPENAVTDAPRFIAHVYAGTGPAAEALANQILDYMESGGWSHTRTPSGHLLRGGRTEVVMPLPDPDRPRLHRWQVMGALRISRLTSRADS